MPYRYIQFVYIQISPTKLILELKNQKNTCNYVIFNGASTANLNADERILKCQPFLSGVYTGDFFIQSIRACDNNLPRFMYCMVITVNVVSLSLFGFIFSSLKKSKRSVKNLFKPEKH